MEREMTLSIVTGRRPATALTMWWKTQFGNLLAARIFSNLGRGVCSGENLVGIGQVFIYLQVLDLLTTLVGFRLGASEASPFIRMLMFAGPTVGVVLSKAIAVGLAGLCLYLKKDHLIRWVNYWYGALVLWNVMILLVAHGRMV